MDRRARRSSITSRSITSSGSINQLIQCKNDWELFYKTSTGATEDELRFLISTTRSTHQEPVHLYPGRPKGPVTNPGEWGAIYTGYSSLAFDCGVFPGPS